MRFGTNVFMPFLVLGDPDEKNSLEYLKALVDGGVSALELGFAFSDPIADGAVIQAANYRALENGITTAKAFSLLEKLRSYTDIPISLMLSVNLVFTYGIDKFYAKASSLKIDAILCPDVPLEEMDELVGAAKKHKIAQVFIVAPTTSEERLRKIKECASGYIYLVSLKGTTGTRDDVGAEVKEMVSRVKKVIDLPVYVGFGISTPSHVSQVMKFGADGVISGSAVVTLVEEGKSPKDIEKFVRSMVDKI